MLMYDMKTFYFISWSEDDMWFEGEDALNDITYSVYGDKVLDALECAELV